MKELRNLIVKGATMLFSPLKKTYLLFICYNCLTKFSTCTVQLCDVQTDTELLMQCSCI